MIAFVVYGFFIIILNNIKVRLDQIEYKVDLLIEKTNETYGDDS